MQLFFALILTHFIADFMLQGNVIGPGKYGVNRYMLTHITITVLTSTIPLLIFRIASSLLWTSLGIIFITHLVIDATRSYLNRRFTWSPNGYPYWAVLGIDQILHVVVLYILITQVLVVG